MDVNSFKEISTRFKRNPLGMVKRVLYKYTLGPLKYGKGSDYQAKKYWDDRFTKFHQDHLAPGDEALNEEENVAYYNACRDKFLSLSQKHQLDFASLKILEIGLGNGFYTKILFNNGAKDYTGVDITNSFFEKFESEYPGIHLIQQDISVEELEGEFDFILLIDVIQHIVDKSKLEKTFANINRALKPGGYFILTPVLNMDKKHFFYLHSWSLQTIMQCFKGFLFTDIIPFKESSLILLQKPEK